MHFFHSDKYPWNKGDSFHDVWSLRQRQHVITLVSQECGWMTLGESGDFCKNHHVDHAWFNWKNSSCASIGGSFFWSSVFSNNIHLSNIVRVELSGCVLYHISSKPPEMQDIWMEFGSKKKTLDSIYTQDNHQMSFWIWQHDSSISTQTTLQPHLEYFLQSSRLVNSTNVFQACGGNFLWNEGCGEYSDRCFGERILLIGAGKNHPVPLVFKVTKWV